jgi:hypothetical protein
MKIKLTCVCGTILEYEEDGAGMGHSATELVKQWLEAHKNCKPVPIVPTVPATPWEITTVPFTKPYTPYWPEQTCLHDGCTQCNGTGQKLDGTGPCVHHISCPCPKCSPRC